MYVLLQTLTRFVPSDKLPAKYTQEQLQTKAKCREKVAAIKLKDLEKTSEEFNPSAIIMPSSTIYPNVYDRNYYLCASVKCA